ncbi:nuclear transport factor 2 family protein [Aquisediminimonas profunda]|uniref:nuclear transport factor 2 family protein n=1 Tax=Aquisediminimonas profunda TaxID=1550733 RepID=UPI001C62CD05|nr:nuclear transport factor 2 family protein [Aquisediminimonas profunda]
MDLAEKLDAIEGIKMAKARYFRGIDTKDRDLLRSIFTDDVELDCRGAAIDPVTGHNFAPQTDEIIRGGDNAAYLASTSLTGVVSVHHASAPEIEITGPNTGSAIWPMVDRLRFGEGAPIKELIGYGHYFDTYERVGSTWRIKTMRLVRTRMDAVVW